LLDGRLRVSVNQGLAPIGRGLRRAGITPDVLTASGLVISAITAWLIAIGELRWAVLGIALSGLVDLLDGSVARTSGLASPRGSFFDSVSDRVSDALVLGGCAWYLAGDGGHLFMLPLAALGLSMLISYERAKAEALGYDARGGLMERAERMVLLGVALFFHLLVPALWIMVVLTSVTAVHRFVKVWRQASDTVPARPARVRHRRPADPNAPRLAAWWGTRRPGGATTERRRTVARRSRP
jgi:CDP-diacylglycerol--glycerol-3-phosphate 3-phosphatidyltransferase